MDAKEGGEANRRKLDELDRSGRDRHFLIAHQRGDLDYALGLRHAVMDFQGLRLDEVFRSLRDCASLTDEEEDFVNNFLLYEDLVWGHGASPFGPY